MLRYLKYAVIAVLAVIALLLIAGVVISLTFDPNDYKDQIAELVEERTGRQLVIGDDLELTIFPWLSVTTGNVSLSNAPGFGDEPFMEVGKLSASMRLLPLLLERDVEISTVSLDGLKLNLAKNKAGVTNWDDLRQSGEATEESESQEEEGFSLRNLDIAGLELTNSQIRWHENVSEVRYIFQEVNIDVGSISADKPIALEGHFKALSVEPQFAVVGDIRGTATLFADDSHHHLDDFRFDFIVEDGRHETRAQGSVAGNLQTNIEQTEFSLAQGQLTANLIRPPVGPEQTEVRANLESVAINLDTQTLKSSGLIVEALGTRSVLVLIGQDIADKPRLSGDIRLEVTSPVDLSEILSELLPETVTEDDIANFTLNGGIGINLADKSMSLNDVEAKALGLTMNGDLTVRNFGDSPTFAGDFEVLEFTPRDLIQQLLGESVPTADEEVLVSASGGARISGSTTGVRLDNIVMKLDQTSVAGWFGVKNFDSPAYEFDLTMDGIDLDRYLAPVDEQAGGAGSEEDIVIPAEQLRGLNMNGRARVNELKMSGIRIQDASIAVSANEGVARFSPMTASMYGGTFDGGFTVNTLGSQPSLAVKGALQNIQLEGLAEAMFDQARIKGVADLSVDLNGVGATFDENMASSVGSVAFQIRNGQYEGFNLGYALCYLHNQLMKVASPDRNVPNVTQFQQFSGTAVIEQGVARTNDLNAVLSFARITGSGLSSLPDQQLNYDIDTTLTRAVPIPGCEAMENLIGESFPVEITGAFDDPKIMPNFEKLLARQLQRVIEKELQKKLFDIFGPKDRDDGN